MTFIDAAGVVLAKIGHGLGVLLILFMGTAVLPLLLLDLLIVNTIGYRRFIILSIGLLITWFSIQWLTG